MKKTQKVFVGFLLAIKIISVIIALAIIILIIDFFAGDNTWQTIVTEIHKDCYIECHDNNNQSIFYYHDGDETEKEYIVEEWAPVLKYATDGKVTVAVCFVSDKAENEEISFLVFNTETEEKNYFVSQEELLDFCKNEKIVLSDWQHAHCEAFGYSHQLKED